MADGVKTPHTAPLTSGGTQTPSEALTRASGPETGGTNGESGKPNRRLMVWAVITTFVGVVVADVVSHGGKPTGAVMNLVQEAVIWIVLGYILGKAGQPAFEVLAKRLGK